MNMLSDEERRKRAKMLNDELLREYQSNRIGCRAFVAIIMLTGLFLVIYSLTKILYHG